MNLSRIPRLFHLMSLRDIDRLRTLANMIDGSQSFSGPRFFRVEDFPGLGFINYDKSIGGRLEIWTAKKKYLFPTTYYQLPITNHLLPITQYLLIDNQSTKQLITLPMVTGSWPWLESPGRGPGTGHPVMSLELRAIPSTIKSRLSSRLNSV